MRGLLLVVLLGCRPAATRPLLRADVRIMHNGFMQDLGAGPLDAERLGSLPSVGPALADPAFHKFVEYLVQCALPEGVELRVGDETFAGSTGLAPGWAEGPCDLECQEWVSACLLARNNAYGLPVVLYSTGTHPALVLEPLFERFPVQEGAFWGNLFVDPPLEYSCGGEGHDPLLSTVRVCAQPGNRCGIQYLGPCGAIDGTTGLASARRVCEDLDEARQAYVRCHDRPFDPDGAPPDGTTVFDRVVTTWVRASAFQSGLGAACDVDAIEPPVPADELGAAGASCDNDEDCDGEQGLRCDARWPHGFCTKACESSADPTAEEQQCGGEGTACLAFAPGSSYCSRACTPRVQGGDCGPGAICTNSWLRLPDPDDPACFPYCSTDADCPPLARCDRNGYCATGFDPEALADGEPCRFIAGTNAVEVACRGFCSRTTDDPDLGVCASTINLAVTRDCPDFPDATERITSGDDLAVCLYRKCETDDDCTAPLVCLDGPPGRICTYR